MSAPKATKIKTVQGKTVVEYESNLEAAEYYLFELNRAALRDVGKFLAKKFREEYYSHFERKTGDAGRATKYKVWASKNTKYPRLQIGLKTGQVPGFYAYFQEFGTSTGIPRLGILTHAAQDNVAEIVKIESQYLSGLSAEASRLESLVDEKEIEGDADGEN